MGHRGFTPGGPLVVEECGRTTISSVAIYFFMWSFGIVSCFMALPLPLPSFDFGSFIVAPGFAAPGLLDAP